MKTAVHDTLATVRRKAVRENRIVLNIHVDGASMRVTPNHRIVVPSTDGGVREVFAQQLNKGDLVMVGDGSTKTITEKECLPDPSLVFEITFHPDVPVPAYFPPAVLPILSKGQMPRQPKPTRRSGMNKSRFGDRYEQGSIPDTEPGLYTD